MRPKIAVVRGHYYSREELTFYRPLQDNFDITFFSSVRGSASTGAGVPVVELPCLDGLLNSVSLGLFGKVFGLAGNLAGIDLEIVFGLKDRLRGFDIVYSVDYDYLLTYYLSRLKARLGFKLAAIHWENIPFARDGRPVARFFKYRTYRSIDSFFAMSERAKASLLLEGVEERRIYVTNYGVDTDRFKPDPEAGRIWRKRFGLSENDLVILFVGRVRASKGVFELIYAAKRLVSDPEIDRKRLKVVIVGRGPRENEASGMINRLGLKENVLQIGYIPHGEMHNAHNMADLFCLPSLPRKFWQEQLGQVFLEAMSCGKPVVSTMSGSIPEVIGDAGILVQPNDHLALYEGLKKAITDKGFRKSMSLKGLDRVSNHFSAGVISSNLKRAYEEVMNSDAR